MDQKILYVKGFSSKSFIVWPYFKVFDLFWVYFLYHVREYSNFILLHVVVHFSGEGNGTPLQYSCLENPMDRGAWWSAVHGVTMSRTWLSHFTFTFHFHSLEKEMAPQSNTLAWRIPGTGEPGGLPSMGLHRVAHDWSDLAAAAAVLFPSTTYWRDCLFSTMYSFLLCHKLGEQDVEATCCCC